MKPKLIISIFFFIIFLNGMSALPVRAEGLASAVVKIFVTSSPIDYYRPWQSRGITKSFGSGVILPDNTILTNAHVVAHHTFIQVKKYNDAKKYTAQVIAIGTDCDLALIKVDNPDFYKNIPTVEIGELPQVQDTVTVLGYPRGGDKLSITEGVVSRIEITAYALSSRRLLTVQIDAAINPGNSGGPVFQNGKLVGIAMQKLSTGQNIGYMIPPPIINHFFNDLKDGQYDGFPYLGIEFEITENKNLRAYFNIDNVTGGVIVESVIPFAPADKKLQSGDIITQINNIIIDEDATYLFRDNERLILTHLISQQQIKDNISVHFIREGEAASVNIPLKKMPFLVPPPQFYDKPPYYIYGGIVFTVLSNDLLLSWGRRWWEKAPNELNYYMIGNGRKNASLRENLVVLLDILSDDVNVGYHNHKNQIIKKINGIKITSFQNFVQTINSVKRSKKYTKIETENNAIIILKNENIDEINSAILSRNNIPFAYSKDVKKWIDADQEKKKDKEPEEPDDP
ncbi:MAG: trypsin-like peptidase domain-containing protein [Candidatus Omnitrophica bacterium]|nr:trypsin-like peptidase domain-containing protein [Candidatus Omnitrophota bacterium]